MRADLICAHCGGRQRGFAGMGANLLCHPDFGMDCYQMVTVYHHPMPCESCAPEPDLRAHVRALTPDGAMVVLSWLATEAGLHPEVAAALERALGCEAETRAK